METILCLSAELAISPGCFSGTGAQPWGCRVIQAQEVSTGTSLGILQGIGHPLPNPSTRQQKVGWREHKRVQLETGYMLTPSQAQEHVSMTVSALTRPRYQRWRMGREP